MSAFLLFQVQLIMGKFLLPWFGGTSAVWTTCLLFFQVLPFAYVLHHTLTLLARHDKLPPFAPHRLCQHFATPS